MIPSDLLNSARLKPVDATVQPVAPTRAVSDLLAELLPGQRIMAEIQSALPNGTYRAMISQREITLALPFSAKSGDALEMEVVESNGRLALAVLTKGRPEQQQVTEGSVATNLSRAGQLIGTLLAEQPRERATPLNGNRPLIADPKMPPADMAPLLKQAVSSSGLFYEAHQARWTAGEFNLGELLKEPQAQTSPPPPQSPAPPPSRGITEGQPQHSPTPPNQAATESRDSTPPRQNLPPLSIAAQNAATQAPPASQAPTVQASSNTGTIAPDLVPLVRQQLESLASNVYVWQGQVWAGQEMRWEVVEEDGKRNASGEEGEPTQAWKTRLHLELPRLGTMDARISLQGEQLTLNLAAMTEQTREQLRTHAPQLADQLEAAGLKLGGFTVTQNAPENE